MTAALAAVLAAPATGAHGYTVVNQMTLTPTPTALGEAFTASGGGCVSGTINLVVQNLLTHENLPGGSLSAPVDGSGNWTANFVAGWGGTPQPGPYQVLGSGCGVGAGVAQSAAFFIAGSSPTGVAALGQGVGPDESPTSTYLHGTGCALGSSLAFIALAADGTEVQHLGITNQDSAGNFSVLVAPPLPTAATWYGACFDAADVVSMLYSVSGGTTPVVPVDPDAPADQPTAPVDQPTADPATAVSSQPRFTG